MIADQAVHNTGVNLDDPGSCEADEWPLRDAANKGANNDNPA